MTDLTALGGRAKAAARELALLDSGEKNRLLAAVAQQVRDDCAAILQANGEDVAAAREAGISESLIDRLLLNEQRVPVSYTHLDVYKRQVHPYHTRAGGGRQGGKGNR